MTSPEEFLKMQKVPFEQKIKEVIADIDENLKKPVAIIKNKVVVALPKHWGLSADLRKAVIFRLKHAGWEDAEFNDTNASYSGFFEIYLYIPLTSMGML